MQILASRSFLVASGLFNKYILFSTQLRSCWFFHHKCSWNLNSPTNLELTINLCLLLNHPEVYFSLFALKHKNSLREIWLWDQHITNSSTMNGQALADYISQNARNIQGTDPWCQTDWFIMTLAVSTTCTMRLVIWGHFSNLVAHGRQSLLFPHIPSGSPATEH